MTSTTLLSSTKLISQLQKVGQAWFSLLKPILTAWFLFFMHLEMFTGRSFFIFFFKWDWPTCISLDLSFSPSCTLLFVINFYQLLWLFKDNWNRTQNHIDKDDGVLLATALLRDLTQLSTMVLCSDFKILLILHKLRIECWMRLYFFSVFFFFMIIKPYSNIQCTRSFLSSNPGIACTTD